MMWRPMIPNWMPFGGAFWVVLTGVAFVLPGLAILSGILDVLAERLLALMQSACGCNMKAHRTYFRASSSTPSRASAPQ